MDEKAEKDPQLVTDHCWVVNSIYPTLQPFFFPHMQIEPLQTTPTLEIHKFCSSRGPFLCLYRRIMEMPEA